MLPPIPKLEDHSISYRNGFLPDQVPLRRLPDRYYEPWEDLVDNLQPLILTKCIRAAVKLLPQLSVSRLRSEAELQRAYSILGFICHSYIWGGDQPAQRLPACISIPFLRVSEALEIIPVASFAGIILWNYQTLFCSQAIDNVENLATLQTFTGTLDESWFYRVCVVIEARCAPVLPRMLEAIAAARMGNVDTVLEFLNFFVHIIEELTALLGRLYEGCDPHVFYFKIRPFLAGSRNMAEAGLPHGVWYEDEDGKGSWRQYAGGSNAQSSLIQAFDLILGVEHWPTGVKKPVAGDSHKQGMAPQKHNFIEEMRDYMPGPHRRFLERLASVANIRQFVDAHPENQDLCDAFNSCLAMLRRFRDKHIQIVSRYVVVQANSAKKLSTDAAKITWNAPDNITPAPSVQKSKLAGTEVTKTGPTGTGGTALMPFLKQARDETGVPAMNPIAKKLLVYGPGTKSPAMVRAVKRVP